MIERLRQYLDTLLEWLLVGLMGAMTLNVLWQVFSRFVLRDPSSYTEELARYLLVWLGLLGGAYGAGRNVHLAIDVLGPKLKGKWKHVADMVVETSVLLFAVSVMIAGGWRLVDLTNALEQISAALRIKLAYVYVAIPLSGFLMAFYALSSFLRSFKASVADSRQSPS